ncbi:unnamed protein product [Paramecium sonneborni]|uniref:Uncharacterized protein n=1 Tax=Paramecium sonneborni TaxID=65129 RepID=A0A8S1KSK5_9CILI|nr:unnamed protein product [Paramecium sonneborni]
MIYNCWKQQQYHKQIPPQVIQYLSYFETDSNHNLLILIKNRNCDIIIIRVTLILIRSINVLNYNHNLYNITLDQQFTVLNQIGQEAENYKHSSCSLEILNDTVIEVQQLIIQCYLILINFKINLQNYFYCYLYIFIFLNQYFNNQRNEIFQ